MTLWQIALAYLPFVAIATAIHARTERRFFNYRPQRIGGAQAFAELLLPLLFGFFVLFCICNWNGDAISSGPFGCNAAQLVAGDSDCD
jgi:hypothetical protein